MVERRTNQLAIREILIGVTFGWHGRQNILHGNTCWTRFYAGHKTARTTGVLKGVSCYLT